MTDVAFHTGVQELQSYACRLLRKAYRAGVRVAVFGPPSTIDRLDQALWTFESLEFIPHVVLPRDRSDSVRLARTPIVLARDRDLSGAGEFGVAVAIGAADPVPSAAFGRIIEIVGCDPSERQAARRLWRAYEQGGCSLTHVDLSNQASAAG